MDIFKEENAFKLYRYLPDFRRKNNPDIELYPPVDLDFITGLTQRLFRKTVTFRGERNLTQYFADYDEESVTFEDLILEVRHTYNRGGYTPDPRLATSRTSSIHWLLEDETFSTQSKQINKAYSNLEKRLEEVQIRRHNASNELANQVISSFGSPTVSTTAANILVWQTEYRSLIDSWIEYGDSVTLIKEIPDNDDSDWGSLLLNGVSASDQFKDYFSTI